MSTDPLWEKYLGWNAYQYSMNNPVSFLDRNGLAVYIIGNRQHVYGLLQGLMQATGSMIGYEETIIDDDNISVEILSFNIVDIRFSWQQKNLTELIESELAFKLVVDNTASWNGGGYYCERTKTAAITDDMLEGRTIYTNKTVREPNGVFENFQSFLGIIHHKSTDVKWTAAAAIAHELLGHGYLDLKGRRQNETYPRAIENDVQIKQGKLPRNYYYGK